MHAPPILAGVMAALTMWSGCVVPAAPQDGFRLPHAPATLEATYQLYWNDVPYATIDATGWRSMPALLGDGQVASLPTISLRFSKSENDEGRGLVYDMHLHQATADLVASATIECVHRPLTGCTLQDRNRSLTLVPDAWGMPGLLGIGPFLGTELRPGQTKPVPLWDPVAPTSVTWTVTAADPHEGKKCMALSSNAPANAKTTLLLSPMWGRLVLCEGMAVPVSASFGPIRFELLRYSGSGEFQPARVEIALQTSRPVCAMALPAHDEYTLPSTAYLDWARREDPFIRKWFSEHPAGQALSSFGKSNISEAPSLPVVGSGSSHTISVMIVLYDPESGELVTRIGKEKWSGSLQGRTGTMEPSDDPGGGERTIWKPRPSCAESTTNLDDVAAKLVQRMGFSIYSYRPMVAPDAQITIQGESTFIYAPFVASSGRYPFELLAEPWPARVYVPFIARPSDPGAVSTSFVAQILGASADPGSGWFRWLVVNPDTWSPS